jgi:hypothetical protein
MSEQQQYGSHGVHSPNGGSDGNLSGFLGGDEHAHNLISHLLGLDHDAHIGAPHGVGPHATVQGQSLQGPAGSASWKKALSAVRLSDVLQGVKLTPNMLFMMLYASFVSWLFVIYWIRHHEPLANSVLGTAAPGSATAAADRRIIAGTKLAFPARTSEQTGDIYVPGEQNITTASHDDTRGHVALPASLPLPVPPVPPVPAPEPQPMPLSTVGGFFPQTQSYAAGFGQPDAFVVSEKESAGTRVKMIVNR